MADLGERHHRVYKVFAAHKGEVLTAGKIAEIAKANDMAGAESVARHHGNPGKGGCPCCNLDSERIFHEVKHGVYSVLIKPK